MRRNRMSTLRLEGLECRTVPSRTTVWTVDDDGAQRRNADFETIQEAIDAARPGDTVRVYAGLYDEQVVFAADKDRIKLESVGRHRAVIAPTGQDGKNSAYVRVNGAEGVVIDGFTITGPSNKLGVGILIHEGGSAVVRDNRITDIRRDPFDGVQTGIGIQVGNRTPDGVGETTGRATITGNTIVRYQKGGIVIRSDGSFADISRNDVIGAGPTDKVAQNGIQVGFGADASVTRNRVVGNSYTPADTDATGIYVFEAGRVFVTDNRLDGNEIGVLAEGQTDPLFVSDNDIRDSDLAGIHLTDTDGAVLLGNRVRGGDGDGIVLQDTTDTTLALNRVTGNDGNGLTVDEGSEDNLIFLNVFDGNDGFDVEDASTGDGTAGTANRYLLNRIGSASPEGLENSRRGGHGDDDDDDGGDD